MSKRGLTNLKGFAILYKLSARDTQKPLGKTATNLENDTEKRASSLRCHEPRKRGALRVRGENSQIRRVKRQLILRKREMLEKD